MFSLNDTKISLNGPNSIIGRAVVIHENEDDLGKKKNKDSLTTGNAGKRIACGIIGKFFKFKNNIFNVNLILGLVQETKNSFVPLKNNAAAIFMQQSNVISTIIILLITSIIQ